MYFINNKFFPKTLNRRPNMKRLMVAIAFAFVGVFYGCAINTFELPQAGPDAKVFAIKDSGMERLRAGNVLFVNRSKTYREVLIFDGRLSESQLIGIGSDGFPVLMAMPIGKFKMGPAEHQDLEEDMDSNRKLVKFLWPGQEYTLLIASTGMSGSLVVPLQVVQGRVSSQPMSERYYYRPWLGPGAGQMTYEVVNDVEFLPSVPVHYFRGTNYLFDKTIDLNQLLKRGIHGVQRQH